MKRTTILKAASIAGIIILTLNLIFFVIGWVSQLVFWMIIISFAIIAWLMRKRRAQ